MGRSCRDQGQRRHQEGEAGRRDPAQVRCDERQGAHREGQARRRGQPEGSGVALLPGSACGMEGFLRLSFTQPEPVLRKAFARIEAAL